MTTEPTKALAGLMMLEMRVKTAESVLLKLMDRMDYYDSKLGAKDINRLAQEACAITGALFGELEKVIATEATPPTSQS